MRLTGREPKHADDARATRRGDYRAKDYVGRVEGVCLEGANACLKVRWHLPAGADARTRKGKVSTPVHVANGVWQEARRRPRNVAVTLERVAEEEYRHMLLAAAKR